MNKTSGIFNIYLRTASIEDASFFMELMNSPDWKHYIADRGIDSIELAEDYIKEKMLPQIDERGYSNNVIFLENSNIPVGSIGLFHRAPDQAVPDIGFSMLPEYYKKGIGYSAGKLLIKKGFEEYDLPGISAYTTHDNIASQKLIEKLGLKYIKDEALPGDEEVLMKYLITKKQYFSNLL